VPLLTVLPEGSVGTVLGFRGALAEDLLPDVPFFSICALKGSVPGIRDGTGVVSVCGAAGNVALGSDFCSGDVFFSEPMNSEM